MDTVCIKGDWDVVLSEDDDGNIEGVLLYHTRKYLGFRLIVMPMQTPYSGIHIFHKKGHKTSSRITFENQVSEKLLRGLPRHDLYYQQYSPLINNVLTHTWGGYKHTTRYTYVLDLHNRTEEQLWDHLKAKARNTIRKAIKISEIKELDFPTFWNHCVRSFENKKQANPYQESVLRSLAKEYSLVDKCKIYACVDKNSGDIYGATLCINDHNTTYYISGFYNPEYDHIGALSYLLWYNISNAKTKYFDFEGSMIKPVEYFFRAFGGDLTPHYKVWKINNPLLRFALKFKKLPFLDW